jgi:hypothetical protein
MYVQNKVGLNTNQNGWLCRYFVGSLVFMVVVVVFGGATLGNDSLDKSASTLIYCVITQPVSPALEATLPTEYEVDRCLLGGDLCYRWLLMAQAPLALYVFYAL